MKVLGVLLVSVFLISGAVAKDSYQYEKKDAITLKTTKTITRVVVSEQTIIQLKDKKADLVNRKQRELDRYNNQIASLDIAIAIIDTKLMEATTLGISEIGR